MRRLDVLRWLGALPVCLLCGAAFAADVPAAQLFSGTPAEQLAAARARLDAFKSYRERREYTEPNPLVQMVEFSGGLQRWTSEFRQGPQVGRLETIWEGGRSARRELPDEPEWSCFSALADRFIKPATTVRDGGALTVDGRPARRLVEEFANEMAGSRVTREVDIDAATGVPLRLTSLEVDGSRRTRYVGTYHDLGVPISIVFPACK